jgi:hypothetical protein
LSAKLDRNALNFQRSTHSQSLDVLKWVVQTPNIGNAAMALREEADNHDDAYAISVRLSSSCFICGAASGSRGFGSSHDAS